MKGREVVLWVALVGAIVFGIVSRAPAPQRYQIAGAGTSILRLDTTTGQTWLWDIYTFQFSDVTPQAPAQKLAAK